MSRPVLLALVSAAALSAGCLGSYGLSPGDGGGPADGGVAGDSATTVDPVAEFDQTVKPILQSACASCHAASGTNAPVFLADPMLDSLVKAPGIIGATPQDSRLYVKGVHEGPAFTADQRPVISQWIVDWNLYKPMTDAGTAKPMIQPFQPVMGANTVDLSVLDPSLAGVTITFTAQAVGSQLELSQITVHTPATSGVHIAHPLWTVWDNHYNPMPDPADSFSNVDETVNANDAQPLGPGLVYLQGFMPGYLINVVFTTAEAKNTSMDGGVLAGCKNVGSFTTNAAPQLQNLSTTAGNTCLGCHGGGNQSATGAFSLVGLNNMPATACVSVRGEVDTSTPTMSTLFKVVDANSGTTHQGGKLSAGDLTTFENGVTVWINAEK